MATIVFATRNPSKLLQVCTLFETARHQILSMDEAGIIGEGEETGSTIHVNAWIKALFVSSQAPQMWSMADDTGLAIDALDGDPGAHAARWAGNVSTDEITEYTLKKLEGVPLQIRTATFSTAIALVPPLGVVDSRTIRGWNFVGSVKGHILESKQCENLPHMPYSSLFRPLGCEKVFAQMTVEEKNAVSHRGMAFRNVKAFLDRYYPFHDLVKT